MLRKSPLHLLLCGIIVAAAPAAVQAQCPVGFALVDLKAGTSVVSTTLASFISYVNAGNPTAVPASAGCPGWKMVALKLVIPATCKQANVVVEYEGLPKAWTVNLGDSPTNDGHAGDGGTTEREAELWVLNEDLALAPANLNPLGIENPLFRQHVSVTDGALKFVVKDQFVSFGQPYGLVQTPVTKNLFAIPDPTVPAADQRAIYLGLNRVIAGTHRTGCGARRALITFQ